MANKLEPRKLFLFEKRTESYKRYAAGVSEKKINLLAKKSCGTSCSAGWQARKVCLP